MTQNSFPKSDGDVLYASEVNSFHNILNQVYTGTGYNTNETTAGSTDEQSQELTTINSSDIVNKTYAKITVIGTV